jgi:integrase
MRSGSLPKRPQTERPVLSRAKVEALACAMTHERDRVLVRLLAYGGLRVGEALALRWSNVDLPRGMLAEKLILWRTPITRKLTAFVATSGDRVSTPSGMWAVISATRLINAVRT